MGAPANSVWLPLMLMAMMISMATAQSNDTSANSNAMDGSISTTSIAPDLVVSGDLSKAARVEQLSSELEPNMVSDESAADANGGERNPKRDANAMSTPKSTEGQYDVIDVMAATSAGVGKPKSGQTTRIYTTGDVNDDFWLKHLGDDFKHAIHLQVGGTNDDYNRIINQTSSGGVHEEVHHEYLPGAERPPEVQQQQQQHQQQQQQQQFAQPNLISQLSLDGEAMALKQNYLRQQEQLRYAQANGYATQHSSRYTHTHNNNNNNRRMQSQQQHTHTYVTHQQQQQQPELHLHQHSHTRTRNKSRHSLRNRYKQQQQQPPPSSIINSSEDTLHAAQSQATPTSAASPNSSRGSSLRGDDAAHNDNPLPFKSPFNDYGSRPTRDLTYLLYKRGL
ncbi:putative uncharacterized protein DDB_G0277255 [Drosophila sulfurigaster albostrigata]|uniref:putative uncharacterized protein DDB_G0277255 n=1 Tax=Drosophila sulfurigaster albostrigata TaxID=89887 RepID=UPI002D219DD2|nr:putative uncharacterized protein DDB_G0277255 [Drosophila sulfurigaster albostrigata]